MIQPFHPGIQEEEDEDVRPSSPVPSRPVRPSYQSCPVRPSVPPDKVLGGLFGPLKGI